MASVFRPPLITRVLPLRAELGWTFNGTINLPVAQAPLSIQLTDPVRFRADYSVAVNSQWYLETSSQELFLRGGIPQGGQRTDPAPTTTPLVALSSQQIGTPGVLLAPTAAGLPPGRQSIAGFQPRATPWAAITSQGNNGTIIPLNPPPSVPGTEYIYYAHHKGIR